MAKAQPSNEHKMLCLPAQPHKMLRLSGWLAVFVLVPAR